MIKGYIFDMDGVLCDSEAFIAEAAIRMFRERYDVEVSAEDFIPFVGAGEDRYHWWRRKHIRYRAIHARR